MFLELAWMSLTSYILITPPLVYTPLVLIPTHSSRSNTSLTLRSHLCALSVPVGALFTPCNYCLSSSFTWRQPGCRFLQWAVDLVSCWLLCVSCTAWHRAATQVMFVEWMNKSHFIGPLWSSGKLSKKYPKLKLWVSVTHCVCHSVSSCYQEVTHEMLAGLRVSRPSVES